MRIMRLICLALAPMVRSNASSRVRCARITVNVFEVTSTHTTAASRTNAKSAYVKIAMSELKERIDWLRSSSGVAALMPS